MAVRMSIAGFCLALTANCGPVGTGTKSIVVEFHSEPMGADVWVDGRLVGNTPMAETYEWPPGTPAKKVEFRLEGYFCETRELSETTPIVAVRLHEASEMITLRVESDPPGATLEVDGTPTGVTPADVRLGAAVPPRSVRVILAGYRSEDVPLEKVRTTRAVKLQLTPLIPRLP